MIKEEICAKLDDFWYIIKTFQSNNENRVVREAICAKPEDF